MASDLSKSWATLPHQRRVAASRWQSGPQHSRTAQSAHQAWPRALRGHAGAQDPHQDQPGPASPQPQSPRDDPEHCCLHQWRKTWPQAADGLWSRLAMSDAAPTPGRLHDAPRRHRNCLASGWHPEVSSVILALAGQITPAGLGVPLMGRWRLADQVARGLAGTVHPGVVRLKPHASPCTASLRFPAKGGSLACRILQA